MRHYTLLLVDYEPRSIERTKRPLVDAGFKVEVATDGLAALEAFAKLKPDLVLIEAMLPKKHGFEVCQELKKTPQGKRTPILITTAVYKGRKYRSQALHIHGCDEYVEKPVADDQLLALVRRFLESPAGAHAPAAADPVSERAHPETRPAPPRDSNVIELIDDAPPEPPPHDPPKKPPKFQASFAAPTARVEMKPAAPAAPSAPKTAPAIPPSRIESASKVPWRTGTSAVVGDLTEDEIMKRLDEILPSDSFNDAPGSFEASTEPQVPPSHAEPIHDEPAPTAIAVADLPESGDLEAVADALAGAEAKPADPSGPTIADDVVALPVSDTMDEPLKLEPTVPPEATDLEAPIPLQRPRPRSEAADVVPFDAGRSGKRGKRSGGPVVSAPGSSRATPAAVPTPTVAPADAFDAEPRRPVIAARAVTEPAVAPRFASVKVFPSVEETPPVRRGMPFWVWAAAVAVLAGGAYLALFRDAAPAEAVAPPVADLAAPPASPVAPAAEPAQDAPTADPVAGTGTPTKERTEAPLVAEKRPPVPAASEKPAPREPVIAPPPTKPQEAAESTSAPSAPPRTTAPARAPSITAPASRADPGADIAGLGVEPVPVLIATPAQPTAKRSVQTGDLVTLSDVDFPPVAVSRPAPQFTPRARLNRQQGTVVLNLLVDERGRVADVQVLRAIPGSDLDEAAANAARGWTFKPAVKDGVNVRVWKVEQITFRL